MRAILMAISRRRYRRSSAGRNAANGSTTELSGINRIPGGEHAGPRRATSRLRPGPGPAYGGRSPLRKSERSFVGKPLFILELPTDPYPGPATGEQFLTAATISVPS